jgi:hypothetical protein
MSLLFATQLAAVATSVLAVFAFITAILAGLAYRKQSREVGILAEQHERELRDRRRDQASRVFVSTEPYLPKDKHITVMSVTITNTSQQPIYDLILLWPYETGEWIEVSDAPSPVLMPGQQYKSATSVTVEDLLADPHLIKAAAVFRDAAGVRWRLQSGGQLDEER